LSHHFKRLIGVTPGQFRKSYRLLWPPQGLDR
jgi:hypothetical protein